jgi:hypothetical protein
VANPLRDFEDALLAQRVAARSVGGPDPAVADAEAQKAESRSDKGRRLFLEMKSLLQKVESGNASAKRKFDQAYDGIFDLGEEAAKAALGLVREYGDTIAQGARGADKREKEAVIDMLENAVRAWSNNKFDHARGQDSFGTGATPAAKKMSQGDNSFAYQQSLESFIRSVSGVLRGDYQVDESWRHL